MTESTQGLPDERGKGGIRDEDTFGVEGYFHYLESFMSIQTFKNKK